MTDEVTMIVNPDCRHLGDWSTKRLTVGTDGWSRMGFAFHWGAGQPCDAEEFWGDGSGSCFYAACPDGTRTNKDSELAPGFGHADRWPSTCPCKVVKATQTRLLDSPPLELDANRTDTFKQSSDEQFSRNNTLTDNVSQEANALSRNDANRTNTTVRASSHSHGDTTGQTKTVSPTLVAEDNVSATDNISRGNGSATGNVSCTGA
eukprot:TRINITY_DN3923_c0_g1_i5.p2 TRINITY_DN3923_c0_g1~~TRINITY_DN3923_c0_g1_i5.p2  ORF type:complete len:205 (+),score=18.45 TRINITY_DN3923_c0_g1_i5:947-1561(+)